MPPTVFDPPRIFNRGAHYFSPGPQSILGNSTFQTLNMDTLVTDTDGFWSAGAPSRLTVPSGAGGVYFIWAGPAVDNPGVMIKGRLLINGSVVGVEATTDGFVATGFGVGGGAYGGPLLFHVATLSAGDYIETQGWNNNGGTKNARTQIGLVELPSNDACLLTSSTLVAATTIYTVASYSSAIYDPTGMRSGNRIVCQRDGYYLMFSSIVTGGQHSIIAKNGSGVPINGSFAMAPSAFGFQDYCVDYLVAGDYIEHLSQGDPAGGSNPIGARELMAFRFGPTLPDTTDSINFMYAYPTQNQNNTGSFPNGLTPAIHLDGEWYDTGGGVPYHGADYNMGMLEGLHLAICKFDCQGALASNQSIQVRLNGVNFINYWTTNRNGAFDTTQTAIALIEADQCDTLRFQGYANPVNVRDYYAVKTNGFVSDAMACVQQIYRRLEVDPTP